MTTHNERDASTEEAHTAGEWVKKWKFSFKVPLLVFQRIIEVSLNVPREENAFVRISQF